LKWEPPPEDIYKINVDALFRVSTQAGGWGFVGRNNSGEFLEGVVGNWKETLVLCRQKQKQRSGVYVEWLNWE